MFFNRLREIFAINFFDGLVVSAHSIIVVSYALHIGSELLQYEPFQRFLVSIPFVGSIIGGFLGALKSFHLVSLASAQPLFQRADFPIGRLDVVLGAIVVVTVGALWVVMSNSSSAASKLRAFDVLKMLLGFYFGLFTNQKIA